MEGERERKERRRGRRGNRSSARKAPAEGLKLGHGTLANQMDVAVMHDVTGIHTAVNAV